MKNLKNITIIFCLIFLQISCKQSITNNEDEKFYEIDLTNNFDDIEINISDFLDNIKVIRLETNENSLLSSFNGFVGEKYIVAQDREKLLQFTSDGKYIGTISTRGKGPREFIQIDGWSIDKNEQYLVFHDYEKDYIYKYNLNTNTYEENIPFENKGYLSKIIMTDDSTLAVLRGNFSDYENLYFYQSTSGTILGGFKKEPVPHPGTWAGKNSIFMKSVDNSILFQSSLSDTVYQINGLDQKPLLLCKTDKPVKTGDKTTGVNVSFLHMNHENVFLQKSHYESIITPTSASMMNLATDFLVFNLENYSVKRMKRIYYNFNGIELDIPFLNFPQNNRFQVSYQAYKLKQILNDAINGGNLTEDTLSKIKQLNSEISENDNPFIITGTCNF